MAKARGFFAGSQIRRAAPPSLLPQCGACGLYKICRTPKIPVGGEGERRVLFVGSHPTPDDDVPQQGGGDVVRHFTGPGGRLLRTRMKGMGFNLDRDAWMTNALICAPPKGRDPTSAEVQHCAPNMREAVETLSPDIIIPMGKAAVASVLGVVWKEDPGKVEKWVGWRIPAQNINAWICPTWDPATIVQDGDPVIDRQFDDHVRTAISLEGKPWDPVPDWRNDVTLVTDPDKAAAWLRKCAENGRQGAVAFDYECNMLKPDGPDAKIVSCSVAYGRGRVPTRCIAYPWHGEAIKATGELLRSPIPKIAANMKFEDRWTRMAFGHRVRNLVWDTCIAAHVADNRVGITSVKFQAFVRCGVPPWNQHIEPFLKTKGDVRVNRILREIDIKDLLTYNGLDSLLEYRVAVEQMDEMGVALPWE